ncbi:NADH pyrophosphatase [Elasticomyces elasticus]|nr:NADH pyrophosphatase [Elasticomyces elasticus]KAK4932658.1 NADH pyrophosphatase [Elasticomyces elasticus]KAK5769679.1 NADH pyrophosphatase [Elasticomyces elasticus]
MPPQPSNPEPAPDFDSMLSRKFGKEVANYFSGSPLNRVGFLRSDHKFLSAALNHPSTSFLLCKDLQPLLDPETKDGIANLKYIKYDDLKAVIGQDPYATTEEEMLGQYDSRAYVPQMVFLGIDERVKDGLSYQGKNRYTGAPYFAIDITPRSGVKEACETLISDLEGKGISFAQGRMLMNVEALDDYHISPPSRLRSSKTPRTGELIPTQAAIYAEARQLLDWNARNPFCAQCGYPTLSVNGGFKRTCPPKDLAKLSARTSGGVSNALHTPPVHADGDATPKPLSAAVDASERPPCATRKGVSNLSFPRTDPTVIMGVVNHKGDKLLLGRQKRWPPHWYSTLAGFAEPAESIEEAVRREVYEEAGVHVGRVVIHSTQPWPYPANLMIGAIGQAIPSGETIDLGNDPELDDAQWFSFEEVREALRVGTSGLGEPAGEGYKEGGLRLPPGTAIANQLMTSVVNGFVSGVPNL